MTQFLQMFSEKVVMIFFACILGVLTILSIVSTCYIDIHERMHYTYINIIDFICFLLIFSLLFLLFMKFKNTMAAKLKLSYLLVFSFVLGVLFIMVAQFEPRADQQLCMLYAKQMHEGDFSAFLPKGYMQIYPQQCGLVLFYYLLGFLVGYENVMFIQLLNVIAYTAFIYCIHTITKKLFHSETLAHCVALFTILFLPLLFFTSFIYGTMIGLAASTYAVLKVMDYMEERRISDCLICALFSGIAVLVRKNYIIVIVAMICVLFVHAIVRAHRKAFFCILLLASSYLCFTKAPIPITEQITGQEMSSGLPSIAWVTMGLQDGGHRANGWYNSYSLYTYQTNDYDAAITSEIAKKDLKKCLLNFVKNPGYATSFFLGKLGSEWNEPSFQIFYVNDVSNVTKESSPFIYNMIQGVGHPVLLKYFDFLLTFIYLGTLLYIIHQWKDVTLWDMIPIIAFIGGFLFHLVWEAKGQYTISYLVLLFPYCLKGYQNAFTMAWHALKNRSQLDKKQRCLTLAPILVVTIVFITYSCVYLALPYVNQGVKKSHETYVSYLTTSTLPKFYINGDYRIKDPVTDQYVTFDNSNKDYEIKPSLTRAFEDTQVLSVETTEKEMSILLKKYSQPLNNVAFKQFETLTSKSQINYYCLPKNNKWSILVAANGSYVFRNSLNYALTRISEDEIIISPYISSDPRQEWAIERVS